MMSGGCLVTSVPDYQDPKRTPPFLVAATADPPLTKLLEITTDGTQKYISTPFQVDVRSEDVGQRVEFKFYYDYGSPQPERPYFDWDPAGFIEPGTLADTNRKPMRKTWTPNPDFLDPGCHTITLIASHQFDNPDTQCPLELSDSSQLTWQVMTCDGAQPCAAEKLSECDVQTGWTARCPETVQAPATETAGSP